MNLTTKTPVEIDTELFRLYQEESKQIRAVESARTGVFHAADIPRDYYHKTWAVTFKEAIEIVRETTTRSDYRATYAQRALDTYTEATATLAAAREAMKPGESEFKRRGGWTRAFLVQNTGGHVHRSMNCSTCFPTTRFAWMTAFSGQNETEIVDAAGELACTICYPTAPVDVLSRPTRMFGPEQIEAQVAREERAAAKTERDAKRIAKGLTADGSEFVVRYVDKDAGGHERDENGNSIYVRRDRVRTEHFKTEQAASQWVVQYVVWEGWESDKAEGFRQVMEAMATKHEVHPDFVRADLDRKVLAKKKRDGRL